MSFLVKLMVVLVMLACLGAQPSQTPTIQVEPSVPVQAVFDRIARTFPNGLQDPLKPDDANELRQLLGEDDAEIVRQAVYYHHRHEFEGPEVDVLARVLAHFHVAPEAYVAALVPLLGSDDTTFAERVGDLLMGAGLCQSEESFNVLARYFSSHKNVPDSFIEVMFRLSPGDALRTVAGEYLTNRERFRELIWTEHMVSDAVWKKENEFIKPDDTVNAGQLLRRIAEWDEWWARLYVAETVSRHAFLRDDQIINRLKRDQHPAIVRALARR